MSRDADSSELTVHLRKISLACMSQPRALQCKGRMHGLNAWQTFDAVPFHRLFVKKLTYSWTEWGTLEADSQTISMVPPFIT